MALHPIGQPWCRPDPHGPYGGQRQGGISTPVNHPFVLLFTGEQGEPYGCRDGWTDDGVSLYSGEGRRGDVQFVRGNRAIRDHVAEGKDLHLFRYVERGYVEYLGQMVRIGHQERLGPDVDGMTRRVLVFELLPISSTKGQLGLREVTEEAALETTSLAELRARALASATDAPTAQERVRNVIDRSVAVRQYVLGRADGQFEGCREPAPFVTDAGCPYPKPHHIHRLSRGGPHHPRWVVALCPTCHRRAHYGNDRTEFRQELVEAVAAKEKHL